MNCSSVPRSNLEVADSAEFAQCDAFVKCDGDLPELSPVLLKIGANQVTLIDRWDRKEEALIAFAAASFR